MIAGMLSGCSASTCTYTNKHNTCVDEHLRKSSISSLQQTIGVASQQTSKLTKNATIHGFDLSWHGYWYYFCRNILSFIIYSNTMEFSHSCYASSCSNTIHRSALIRYTRYTQRGGGNIVLWGQRQIRRKKP